MPSTNAERMQLNEELCQRALRARDPRFDGVFFVGITTTGIYCRPVCPSRFAKSRNRRFFQSAASAEMAGYRPCLRCRPELAPGRALMDAVPRLAQVAARRIGAGAMNGHGVADLADELGVSPRHLRRALEREIGVSPVELAQTHRLLLAKRLLADTRLPVTRIAFASGFQSLRRFNDAFRSRYRLSPSALRRGGLTVRPTTDTRTADPIGDFVRLTLAYRAPFAWDTLTELLACEAMPGVEYVREGAYARTVSIDGVHGVVLVTDAAAKRNLSVGISTALLPALMPLLGSLRHVFDLDAEPEVIETHLSAGGLGALVRSRPGLRLLGAVDGFEAVLRVMVRRPRRVVTALGEPLQTGIPGLTRLMPRAERVAETGVVRLGALGISRRRAATLVALAEALASKRLQLEPGGDVIAAHRTLMAIDGVDAALATGIVTRALGWPDAFPATDPALQRAAAVSNPGQLRARAEAWHPWRAYAALHLRLQAS